MRILGARFYKLNSTGPTREYRITFSFDETQKAGALDFVKEIDESTDLILMVFDSSKEGDKLVTETPEQTRARFFKHMHGLIDRTAKLVDKTPTEVKENLKQFLINKKYIVKSSKELDLRGLAAAIFYLKTEYKIDDSDFDFTD
jgi:hypothetical protein